MDSYCGRCPCCKRFRFCPPLHVEKTCIIGVNYAGRRILSIRRAVRLEPVRARCYNATRPPSLRTPASHLFSSLVGPSFGGTKFSAHLPPPPPLPPSPSPEAGGSSTLQLHKLVQVPRKLGWTRLAFPNTGVRPLYLPSRAYSEICVSWRLSFWPEPPNRAEQNVRH